MSSLLKDIYSPSLYDRLANSFLKTIPDFDKQKFLLLIFTDEFQRMELKERMRHTAKVMHEFMPDNYPKAVDLIQRIIIGLRQDGFVDQKLEYMFLSDYIEVYGLDDYESSIKALEFVTQFISCEFAVRPFILRYGNTMIRQMEEWSKHTNVHVRRFSSEGSRPRLPWAMAIPALKKDPSPILPILENLKSDPSEYVRRSVANSLNDIAKDHPQLVIEIAGNWKGLSKETDAIIKHGSRTLLKQGHTEILKYYGLESGNITITNFKILTPEISIGDGLEFYFLVTNNQKEKQTVRLEYAIFYQKANGQLAKKVFKISERPLQAGESVSITRKQSFKLITTRTFYSGEHQIAVIANGEQKVTGTFILKTD